MNRRKAELVEKLRDRRAQLDATFDELDARVAEISRLPQKVHAEAAKIGRWTALAVVVTAVTIASVLIARALMGPRSRARRRD